MNTQPATTTDVLIQHNPNEGLKLPLCGPAASSGCVLIQHNPNEGLKQVCAPHQVQINQVLIQHNPNEGLKPPASRRSACGAGCSFSTTRTRD